MAHPKPYAMVLYENSQFPIATDMDKLEWADGEGPYSAETQREGK